MSRRHRICGVFLVALLALAQHASAKRILHVRDFGAAGDGRTLDTAALQRALDAAAARGGGTVVLEPGTYLSGPLFVKSHTHLLLAKGATLLGTTQPGAYPLVATRAAGIEMPWPAALINIAGQQDVSIEGSGVIDGDGDPWWQAFWSRVPAYSARGLRWAVDYDVQRPELMRIYQSDRVRIGHGLLLRRSAFWTVHICYSTHVVVDGLTIRDNDGTALGPSTDGVDIDSSSHVLVQHVDISNNDDAICLKAGMNADGIRVNRPTVDVVIRHAIIRQAISGIAIGSDTAGGFRHVRVSDVTILGGVRYGIYMKSTHTRGGWTDDVRISRVRMQGVKTAVMIDLNYFPAFSTPVIPAGIESNLPPGLHAIPAYWHILAQPVPPGRGTPHFRDVTLDQIAATDAGTGFEVNAAADAPLVNFRLENIHLQARQAGFIRHTQGWRLTNVTLQTQDGQPLAMEDNRQMRGAVRQEK